MEIKEFQRKIFEDYYERDKERGLDGTFRWLVEEVGELAKALRGEGDLEEEIADVIAWTFSVANLVGVDVEKAIVRKYYGGEPREDRSGSHRKAF